MAEVINNLSEGSIELPQVSAPGDTVDKLYNVAGDLTFNGINISSGGGISNIIEDTTPQLGGNMDVNGFDIESINGGDITLSPGVDVLTAGTQEVDVGGTRVGGDATGLANDATVYTASIVVDGGSSQPIAITGSAAQTYTTLLSELGTDTTGAVWSLTGGNLLLTSSSTGLTSSIAITDTDLFSTLTTFVAVNAATAGTGSDGAIVITDTSAPLDTTVNKLYSVAGALTWNGTALLRNVVEDTTPELGGDLDVSGYSIIGAAGSGVGAGGAVTLTSGVGGSNGPGGTVNITAGAGGAITGDGGVTFITGGSGGTVGDGGAVSVTGGVGSSTASALGGAVNLVGGASGSGANSNMGGGPVNITGGSTSSSFANANSGNVVIAGGTPTGSTVGSGGNVSVTGGESDNRNGGNATLKGGYGYEGDGGDVIITGGVAFYTADGFAGDVRITGGEGQYAGSGYGYGGDIRITGGDGHDDGGSIFIKGGETSNSGDGGSISLQPGLRASGTNAGVVNIFPAIAGFSTFAPTQLRFHEATGNPTAYVSFEAAAIIASSVSWILPVTDSTGTQALVSDGAGTLSWATIGGGIANVVEDTTPQLGGQLDVNGNAIGDGTLELITFTETGSAVNQINITNAATTNGPIISAAGGDTNIDLNLSPKGTGKTKITSIEAPLDTNTQTGTTYGPVLTDAEKMITLDNASAITVTIPANASVAYPIGTKLNFMQLGAGQVTIAITTDTLNVESTLTLLLVGQYAVATAFKVTATTWVLFGNLAAV